MQLKGLTIYQALNQSDSNKLTSIKIPRGNGVRLPCAIFAADPSRAENLVTDLSNINFARIVMRETSATGTLLATQQIQAAG